MKQKNLQNEEIKNEEVTLEEAVEEFEEDGGEVEEVIPKKKWKPDWKKIGIIGGGAGVAILTVAGLLIHNKGKHADTELALPEPDQIDGVTVYHLGNEEDHEYEELKQLEETAEE